MRVILGFIAGTELYAQEINNGPVRNVKKKKKKKDKFRIRFVFGFCALRISVQARFVECFTNRHQNFPRTRYFAGNLLVSEASAPHPLVLARRGSRDLMRPRRRVRIIATVR